MLFDETEDDLIDDEGSGDYDLPEGGGLPQPRFATTTRGHDVIEKQLLDLINAGKLPHAMIFAGPQGIGKATLAFRLTKHLLAQKADAGPSLFGAPEPASGASLDADPQAQSTRLVLSGGHPDLLVVERKVDETKNRAKDVDVEQVRAVPGFLHMTPFMGGWRIVIIDDADTMTRSSQNAILKILEEPPQNSLLILIAHRPGLMIPTIRSRCRMIEFPAPGREDFDSLMKQAMPQVMAADLAALYNISGGSIGHAMRLMQDGALKSLHQLSALLAGWPELSWKDIHLAGEVLGGKGQDDTGLQGFQDILLWTCETITKAKARGEGILPAPLNDGPFPRLLGHYGLEDWSKICDNLKTHFATVKYGSLDRRQAVFGAFSILKAGNS